MAILTIALLVFVLALSLSGAARSQVVESVTRQPTPFVQLSFHDPAKVLSCNARAGRLVVPVTVTNHTQDQLRLRLRFTIASMGSRAEVRQSAIVVNSGESLNVRRRIDTPGNRAYTVKVTIPGRTEHLTLRCGRSS